MMPWQDSPRRLWKQQTKLAYAGGMISMGTFSELHDQKHTLGLYCITCNRWETADLERLITLGYGHRTVVQTRFSCRDCGKPAEKQLRPPVPEVSAAAAYI